MRPPTLTCPACCRIWKPVSRLSRPDFPLEDFKKVHYQQQPFVTLLTCCDSRVPPTMLGDTFNRVFCIENIGNQFKNGEGSVLYGLLHLHTPLMIVAGHSECGAIKAATSDYAAEPPALVQGIGYRQRLPATGLRRHQGGSGRRGCQPGAAVRTQCRCTGRGAPAPSRVSPAGGPAVAADHRGGRSICTMSTAEATAKSIP